MGSGKSRNTYFYDNDKLYFSHDAVLWGNLADSEEEAPTMPAGEYSLSFDYLLPKDIPFSFETADIEGYGHVRYTCKATIGKTSHLASEDTDGYGDVRYTCKETIGKTSHLASEDTDGYGHVRCTI